MRASDGLSGETAMTILAFVTGVILLCILVADVYSTVFVPRGEAGLASRRFYSLAWRGWKWIGGRMSGTRRRAWLAQFGPILVPLTVMLWGFLLILSFTLMYVPWVEGFSISPPESGPVPDWALVLYYSGYSAVTLGVGDVTPSGTTPRLMAVAEAGAGFALFTAAVSYLLSVYSALGQSTSLALAISRFVGRRDGQTPVLLLARAVKAGVQEEMDDWLGRMAYDFTTLVQLREQYPLLHYFHEPNDDRSIAVALSDLLELVTLCQAMLDPDEYPALAEGPTIKAVDRIGRHYFAQFDGSGAVTFEEERRRRYTGARKQLADAAVLLRADEDSWAIYSSLAREWDVADHHLRDRLGYPSVTPQAQD